MPPGQNWAVAIWDDANGADLPPGMPFGLQPVMQWQEDASTDGYWHTGKGNASEKNRKRTVLNVAVYVW